MNTQITQISSRYLPIYKDEKEIDQFISIYIIHAQPELEQREMLYFEFNIDVDSPEQIQNWLFIAERLKLMSQNSPYLLKIIDYGTFEKEGYYYFWMKSDSSYHQTLESYHIDNNCLIDELMSEMYDLYNCYKICIELNLPIVLQSDRIGLVMTKTMELPYPRIVLSPFGFIDGYTLQCSSVPIQSVHSYFGQLIYQLDEKIKKVLETPLFSDISMGLLQHMNMLFQLQNHPSLQVVQNMFTLNQFNIDQLKFVRKLGNGTSGSVFQMHNPQTNQHYAMKESDCRHLRYLHRESYVLKTMYHKNIISFFGFIMSDRTFLGDYESNAPYPHGFMLMEYCPGGSLEEYIYKRHQNGITVDEVMCIFGQICSACIYLHDEKRMMHRDLKLSNILLVSDKPFPYVKLCDFGITRTIDKNLLTYCGSGLSCDTRILERQQYDDSSELFSLGCILYYLIYRKYPCEEATTIQEVIQMNKEKKITIRYENVNNVHLQEMINLIKRLLRFDDRQMTWKDFRQFTIIRDCINNFENKCKNLQNRMM